MQLADVNATTGAILGVVAVLGVLVGWLKWARPRWHNGRREVTAVRDAILGREAIIDSITGKEIQPPLPGMGVRMAHQEQQMDRLTEAVAQLASTHTRLENHEDRILKLEAATVERIMVRAESEAAWRAMEAAAGLQPDHIDVDSDDDS